MDFQNYEETKPVLQNQQITYEPVYPTPTNQECPPQVYPSNSQQNQFNLNPQNQNYNIVNQQPIFQNNPYFLIPQEPLITPFESNKLEIPFEITQKKCCFITFMLISILSLFLTLMISIENIYAPIILIIELLIFLYFEKKKIVIIKDESENKVYIKVINYLFIEKKKIIYNLDNINLNIINSNQKYLLLIFNNC